MNNLKFFNITSQVIQDSVEITQGMWGHCLVKVVRIFVGFVVSRCFETPPFRFFGVWESSGMKSQWVKVAAPWLSDMETPFLVGNPYKPSFVTVFLGGGTTQ